MIRLSQEYPGDLGIMMPLILNFLKLETGQAFFMTVDEPHAYLRGDILEVKKLQCVSFQTSGRGYATLRFCVACDVDRKKVHWRS